RRIQRLDWNVTPATVDEAFHQWSATLARIDQLADGPHGVVSASHAVQCRRGSPVRGRRDGMPGVAVPVLDQRLGRIAASEALADGPHVARTERRYAEQRVARRTRVDARNDRPAVTVPVLDQGRESAVRGLLLADCPDVARGYRRDAEQHVAECTWRWHI